MAPIDWQTRKTLSESTKYLLDNTINCDVNFKVGENQEIIKAHKLILSIRSAVFEKIFNGSFCESGKDPVILDVLAAAFQSVLRYCYYDCTDILDDIALSVLYASTKYMLPLLEEAARKKVIEILSNPKYIWDVYKYAIDVGDTELLDTCREYFQGDVTPVREALQAEAFLKIPHNVLLDFLHINDESNKSLLLPENHESDSLKTNRVKYQNCIGISISEIELFKACNLWAEAECQRGEIESTGANKRKVLGDCLFLLRFPIMLPEDLADDVCQAGVLTQDEFIKLWKLKYSKTTSDSHIAFPVRERQFVITVPVSDSAVYIKESILYIESQERVLLPRIWVLYPGSYRLTVKNEKSERSWSTKADTQYGHHIAKTICTNYKLYFIELESPVLDAGSHSVTLDRIEDFKPSVAKPDITRVFLDRMTPFKDIKVSVMSDSDVIFALTLCLV